MKSIIATLVLVIALFVLSQAVTAPRANADISGGCVATVGGANANDIDTPGTALEVDYADDVPVTMTSPSAFDSHQVDMEWTGLRWTVSSEDDDGTDTTFADTVAVSDYAKYGVGIYKVWAVGDLVNGTRCEGEIYVNVTNKSPISTPAGAAAAAAAAAGLLALSAAAFAAAQAQQAAYQAEMEAEKNKCCSLALLPALLLTVAAMTTGGGGAKPAGGPAAGDAKPATGGRMKFRPRLSVLGVGGGIVGSFGGLIYMQQSGSVYPTLNVTIASVVIGLLLGAGIPTAIRSLGIRRGKGKAKKTAA